jgi:hypothetical protein
VYYLIFILLSQSVIVNCQSVSINNVFIRTNQVGFLPHDIKTAVILSNKNLSQSYFSLIDVASNEVVYQDKIDDSTYVYGKFNFCYEIDFSPIKQKGEYLIRVDEIESNSFKVDGSIYNSIRDSIGLFFKVQRCGPTNPLLHQPCHLSDASIVFGYKDSSARDLTGGWHDAGDYVKFLKTSAYTTYILMFSYEFDSKKFDYDLDNNNVPDILEEAKVGLDWLLRCNVDNQTLVSQVQNQTDHNIGWRLPENDSLQFNRPAFVSIGKNTIGLYAATLALASRIWKEEFYEDNFAQECLSIAEKFYSLRNEVQDIDTTFSNHYPEKDFNGKLALAAIELYNSTGKEIYLKDALEYGNKAGADFWWSVGDINSLAHYKISKYKPEYSKYIYQNLKHSHNLISKSIFREALRYSWGTTNTFLGLSFQTILYKRLTDSDEFDSLSIFQRDFILGRNPWGISFIYNIGKTFTKDMHSQVGFFNNGYLPGALSAGPAPIEILEKFNIKRSDTYLENFSTDSVKYFDDRADFITNEPTIIGNATALFVFGYYSKAVD